MPVEIPDINLPVERYPINRAFYSQGEVADKLYIIRHGIALSSLTLDNNRTSRTLVVAPAVIGLEALIGQDVYQSGMQAHTASRAQVIDKPRLERLLSENPLFGNILLASAVELSLREARRRAVRVNGSAAAVANILLEFKNERFDPVAVFGLRQPDLGLLTGFSRERVNKVMVTMREEGTINYFDSREISLLDLVRLEYIVNHAKKSRRGKEFELPSPNEP